MSERSRANIRREIKRVLRSLDRRWLQAASRDLCSRLGMWLDLPEQSACRQLLAWVPYFAGEVDLTDLIEGQMRRRTVYLPRVLPDRTMSFISIGTNWLESMQRDLYGIPGPNEGQGKPYEFSLAAETIAIMPGLAFDLHGNRLGRGQGYYDRFLAQDELQEIRKVGVCWSLQLVPKIPIEAHDVPVERICTEEDIIGVKSQP